MVATVHLFKKQKKQTTRAIVINLKHIHEEAAFFKMCIKLPVKPTY